MRTVLILAYAFLIYSCGSGDSTSAKDFQPLSLDTSGFEWHQPLTRALNLPELRHGVDSFELRLFSSLATTDLDFLTCLRFVDSAWHLTQTRYWTSYTNNYPKPDLIIIDSLITRKINPIFDYSLIMDSIEFFDLKNIPDQDPQLRDRTADGMFYTIEIATNNSYKILWYHNPKLFEDSIHRRINRILNFFRKSLNAFVME